jgi:hypothetical protein
VPAQQLQSTEFKPQYCKEKKERKEIRELQLRLPLEVAVGWFLLW